MEKKAQEVSARMYNVNKIMRHIDHRNRFEQLRKARELATKVSPINEEFQLDYLRYYPEPQRTAIIASLTAPPPTPLPPLDVTTISYYRRLQPPCPIFQTRLPGFTELDPHLTHESLHILSILPDTSYPNFAGLTKEFERDLRLYLSLQSKDIRTMAVVAAGNRIIGKEKDVLFMVEQDEDAIWVLFNHIFSEKISYQALLPYIVKVNPVAFRAFYELSNVNGHESIAWFFQNEEVVDALMRGLESPEAEIRNLTMRILGNILGEPQQNYVTTLIYSPFLDRIFRFLISSQSIDRKDGCWVLANFCSSELGANALLRKSLILEKLVEMLYYENALQVRRELVFIFDYLICYANRTEVFQIVAKRDFLDIMALYLSQGDTDLSIATLNIIRGLIELGEDFKDEYQTNVVGRLIKTEMFELMGEIRKGLQSQNSSISDSAEAILSHIDSSQKMEGEC